MKRLIPTSLSVLSAMLIFAASNPANAQTRHNKQESVTQTAPSKTPNSISPHLTPFHLVNLSYQGYFTKQGIPSFATFISEYRQKKITARDLVKAGIEHYMLSADMLNDQEYINAVDSQFLAFNTGN
ncbi:hypothetical protein NIES4071_09460 [Calothrix sp. NIES-4071]|nr:hypothetical protein NIES4071_09460 [Calothrix sp. NIES-4071]BAZ55288.1 hypothetical protein NIES4105_09420 [Calothrix sp. NIES-4105]